MTENTRLVDPRGSVTFAVVTFGCRVNQADSLQIEADLLARGAQGASPADADLVIVNTCSVTASADQGARQTIRRIARQNPAARVVVTGCYASRQPDDVQTLPSVLRVVRNTDKERLADAAMAAMEMTTAARFGDGAGSCGAAIEPGVAGRTAFTLRVQTGCEETCAYCIIPTTRGATRSVPIHAVTEEVRRIAAAGFREIALTGVHLGSYGRDLSPQTSLFELLCALQTVDADVRFRISSLEPMDCSSAIVNLVAQSQGRFAPHFHLPLQHASDAVLARMQRPYTLDAFRALVAGILQRLPHAAIGTDLIVGFPGESEDEFDRCLEYLPTSRLSHLHVFPYSDRPGTVAAAMVNKVCGSAIRERAARLRTIGADLSAAFRASQRGTVRPGLTLEDGTLVVTDNYLKVRIPSGLPRNRRVSVSIEDVEGTVRGRVVADG